jgi:uncharacterized protein
MALDCPRCNVGALEEIELGDVLVDRCDTCGGIWFDNGEIEQVTGGGERAREIEVSIPPVENAVEEMACPRCPEVALRRHEPEGQAGCVVHRCVSCAGTWLDRGRLRSIEDEGLKEKLTRYFE